MRSRSSRRPSSQRGSFRRRRRQWRKMKGKGTDIEGFGGSDMQLKDAKQSVIKEGFKAADMEDTGKFAGDDCDKNESHSDSENEEETDPSLYMYLFMTERRRKEFDLFVGGLDKEVVEDDLLKVFGEFGEIQYARIAKQRETQRRTGFAFIRYATVEQAKKVLAESKNGMEVRGKQVRISASVNNDTLYLGNVCKTWAKDQVLEKLKSLGVEQIEEMLLPDDPKKEGKNVGFAFLELSSDLFGMAAFQRLRKPDALFGCDGGPKVAFAQVSMHPSEKALSQVKANLAARKRKRHFAMQEPQGGFKVKKNGELGENVVQPRIKGQANAKDTHTKGKALLKLKTNKDLKLRKFPRSHGKVTTDKGDAVGCQKFVQQIRHRKLGRKDMIVGNGAHTSEKAHNNCYAERSTHNQSYSYSGASGSRPQNSDLEPHAGYIPATHRGKASVGQRVPKHEIQQSVHAVAYDKQHTISAGGYDGQVTIFGGYGNQHMLVPGSVPQSLYPAYLVYGGHQAGYAYPWPGAYVPTFRPPF